MKLMILASLLAAQALAAQGTDADLQKRVASALHADPYFYDAHVQVEVKGGAVILKGLVFSDWDLRSALRIAAQAAGGHRVVDELELEIGGRR